MSLDDRKPWEQKAKDERAKGGQVIRPGAAKPDSQRLDSQGENLCVNKFNIKTVVLQKRVYFSY